MQRSDSMPLPPGAAQDLGLQALAWMAGDAEVIGGLLAASGGDVGDLRARAAEPEFLGFVLDYLLSDESLLLAFCAASGVAPDRPARARAALPGGDLPHWT